MAATFQCCGGLGVAGKSLCIWCILTDGDVQGVRPLNQYMLCGENKEKMMLLTSSNQVENMLQRSVKQLWALLNYILFKNIVALLHASEIW